MIVMTMIVMLVEMKTDMVMERKEIGDIEMMTNMVEVGTLMAERGIDMVGMLMNVLAEMVTEMMTIEEVVEMMIISMVQEIGASAETVPLMMMTAHLGNDTWFYFAKNEVFFTDADSDYVDLKVGNPL